MTDKVAIVTGGASGIGRAVVELLESQGVSVAAFDLTGSRVVDISDREAVESAVLDVQESMGPVGILVNAAGVPAGGPLTGETYLDDWDRAFSVNVTGAMLMARACMGDLVLSGSGRIVNIASTEGIGAGRGTGPYAASKHAMVGLTRSLAVDYGRAGVTVNCVCPGATLTGMTEGLPADARDAYARRHVPVGRYAQPEEIAFMVVALTSADASYVNGAIIPVDGGLTAQVG